jgi:acyl-CoA synthetase (AMP-forming)/AMP-acid ligase II
VKATHCMSATPFLQELVAECTRRGDGLPTLRYFACGGASVPPELIRHSHQVFARCRSFRIWGCTEAPLISQGVTAEAEEALAAETDGRIFNYEVRVLDAADQEVGIGAEGELLARGPSLSLGYTNEEMTRESFTDDGFFRTGDLGYVSQDGSVVITGRKKDLIIRGGQNISAKEIEDVLHTHPAIEEAAVVSMPHARLGEGICAYLRLRGAGPAPTIDDLQRFLLEAGLARQKAPERVEVLSEYPRTAAGKIKKDILRQMIRDRLASEMPTA